MLKLSDLGNSPTSAFDNTLQLQGMNFSMAVPTIVSSLIIPSYKPCYCVLPNKLLWINSNYLLNLALALDSALDF